MNVRCTCAQVHYPPYLFEGFLGQPVEEVGSSARVSDAAVLLRLLKKTREPWEDLLADAGTRPETSRLASEMARRHGSDPS